MHKCMNDKMNDCLNMIGKSHLKVIKCQMIVIHHKIWS